MSAIQEEIAVERLQGWIRELLIARRIKQNSLAHPLELLGMSGDCGIGMEGRFKRSNVSSLVPAVSGE